MERMTYLSEESKVTYCFKDGKQEKVFGALEMAHGHGFACPKQG
jgi:hypothetical protein